MQRAAILKEVQNRIRMARCAGRRYVAPRTGQRVCPQGLRLAPPPLITSCTTTCRYIINYAWQPIMASQFLHIWPKLLFCNYYLLDSFIYCMFPSCNLLFQIMTTGTSAQPLSERSIVSSQLLMKRHQLIPGKAGLLIHHCHLLPQMRLMLRLKHHLHLCTKSHSQSCRQYHHHLLAPLGIGTRRQHQHVQALQAAPHLLISQQEVQLEAHLQLQVAQALWLLRLASCFTTSSRSP